MVCRGLVIVLIWNDGLERFTIATISPAISVDGIAYLELGGDKKQPAKLRRHASNRRADHFFALAFFGFLAGRSGRSTGGATKGAGLSFSIDSLASVTCGTTES